MREAWLYMIFPDTFENISSRKDKGRIRDAFQNGLENGPTDNIDADLLEIRRQLTRQRGDGFHFYRSPVIEQWRTEKKVAKKAKTAEAALRARRRLREEAGDSLIFSGSAEEPGTLDAPVQAKAEPMLKAGVRKGGENVVSFAERSRRR
jgi:hypothetical protein